MKKKAIYFIVIAIVLLICIIVYFKPLSLLNTVSESSEISIMLTGYVTGNGEQGYDTVEYKDIAAEQKSAILTLLENYSYRRTIGTPFSNGSMSGLGNKMLSIYMFGDNISSGEIFVTSSGEIRVNAKNYYMENAEQFIEQIIEIVEQTD